MSRKFKIFTYMIVALICNLLVTNVYAASSKISVSSSKKQVLVGDTVKVTITVSSPSPLGSWTFDVNYNNKVLTLVSSNLEGGISAAGVVYNKSTKTRKYTMTFKAKTSGSATIAIRNSQVFGYDEKSMNTSNGSISIKSITQKELESSYSSVNTLSSLSINGQKLSPAFSKNTTKYNLTVENKITSINVSAKATDSKARISGIGTKKLSEGSNKINIVVTAENGNKKTYTINVTRKELNPIIVKINDEEYTVVRNKNKLEAPDNYSNTTVTIEGENVPALENETTGYKLLGLINPKGETNLYVYNNDTYTLYNEYKFGGITLYVKEVPEEDMLKNITEKTIKLGDEEITSYIMKDLNYPLVYGMNIETGKTNWYTYDEEEKSLQKFISSSSNVTPVIKYSDNKLADDNNDKYIYLSIILGSISIILLIGLIVSIVKLNKRQEA